MLRGFYDISIDEDLMKCAILGSIWNCDPAEAQWGYLITSLACFEMGIKKFLNFIKNSKPISLRLDWEVRPSFHQQTKQSNDYKSVNSI
jgi:hypothetical protein